jgi:RNA polymerase sigma factor (sigma-70 family)
MTQIIESLIQEFKDLKQKNRDLTIRQFIERQPSHICDELACRLYPDMVEVWVNQLIEHRAIDWFRKFRAHKRGGQIEFRSIDDISESIDDEDEDDNPFMRLLESPDNPEAELIQKEMINAFERLNERQRAICKLYYVDGYNDREIGELLDMKENSVTKSRHRATKKLRQILRRMEYHE